MQQVNDKRSLVLGGSLRGAKRLLILQALLALVCLWVGLLIYSAGSVDIYAIWGMMAVGLVPVLTLVSFPGLKRFIGSWLRALMSASGLMLLAHTVAPGASLQGPLFVLVSLICAAAGLWLASQSAAK